MGSTNLKLGVRPHAPLTPHARHAPHPPNAALQTRRRNGRRSDGRAAAPPQERARASACRLTQEPSTPLHAGQGNLSVAAGPFGRQIEGTGVAGGRDQWQAAACYSYAVSRGLFAGIALDGMARRRPAHARMPRIARVRRMPAYARVPACPRARVPACPRARVSMSTPTPCAVRVPASPLHACCKRACVRACVRVHPPTVRPCAGLDLGLRLRRCSSRAIGSTTTSTATPPARRSSSRARSRRRAPPSRSTARCARTRPSTRREYGSQCTPDPSTRRE